MPSSPKATLVPLRRITRERLLARKGDATFDATINALLDSAPASLLPPRAPPAASRSAEPPDRRSPAKQRLLRELVREAWLRRLREEAIREVGPRLLDWTPPVARDSEVVENAIWPKRRGFSP